MGWALWILSTLASAGLGVFMYLSEEEEEEERKKGPKAPSAPDVGSVIKGATIVEVPGEEGEEPFIVTAIPTEEVEPEILLEGKEVEPEILLDVLDAEPGLTPYTGTVQICYPAGSNPLQQGKGKKAPPELVRWATTIFSLGFADAYTHDVGPRPGAGVFCFRLDSPIDDDAQGSEGLYWDIVYKVKDGERRYRGRLLTKKGKVIWQSRDFDFAGDHYVSGSGSAITGAAHAAFWAHRQRTLKRDLKVGNVTIPFKSWNAIERFGRKEK